MVEGTMEKQSCMPAKKDVEKRTMGPERNSLDPVYWFHGTKLHAKARQEVPGTNRNRRQEIRK